MRRSTGVDVLRGLAVALVMARHAWPEVFPGAGVVGVVMFFALSGHLITASLIAEHEREGRVSLRGFYLRRAVRLVPALVVMLLGFTALVLVLDPWGDRHTLPGTWLVALTWTANLPLGVEVSDAAFHLWTLAGEEQFYLVWPMVLLWALPRGRAAQVVWGATALCAVGVAGTALWLGPAADVAYALPTSWAVCFVIGGASALAMRAGGFRRWAESASSTVVPLALVSVALLAVLPVRGSWWTYVLVAPLVAALTAMLVVMSRAGRFVPEPEPGTGAVGRGVAAAVWLGQRSYAAYLWNYPVALWLRTTDLTAHGQAVLGVVVTLVLAEASWRLVEEPCQRWARRRARFSVPVLPVRPEQSTAP